jgi:hypothetical protein
MNPQEKNAILNSYSDQDIIELTNVTSIGLKRALKKYKYRYAAIKRLVYLNNQQLYYSKDGEIFRR